MRCHSVGIVARLWAERQRSQFSIPGSRLRYFPFSNASIPSMKDTQSSIRAYRGHFIHCWMWNGGGTKLTTLQQAAPSRITRGAVSSPSFYVFMWWSFSKQGYISTFTKCSNVSFELEKGVGARLTAHTVTFCCDIQERNARVSRLIHTASFLPKLTAERICMAVDYTAKRGTD